MEDDWITLTYWLPINTLSGLCPATSLGKYFMHWNLMKCADIIYSLTIIYRWSFNPSKINRFKSNVVPIVNQIQRKNQIRRFRKKRRRNVSTPSQTLAWILHTRFEKEWKAWGKHTNTMLERFSGKRWTQKKHETALHQNLPFEIGFPIKSNSFEGFSTVWFGQKFNPRNDHWCVLRGNAIKV